MANDFTNTEHISLETSPSLVPDSESADQVKWSEYKQSFFYSYPVPPRRDRGIRYPLMLTRDFSFPNTNVMIIPLEATRGQAVFLNDLAGMTVIPAAHFDRAGNMLWLPIAGLIRSTREDMRFPYQVDPHPWQIRGPADFYKVAKAWSTRQLESRPHQWCVAPRE